MGWFFRMGVGWGLDGGFLICQIGQVQVQIQIRMSENQFMLQKKNSMNEDEQEDKYSGPVLDAYQPNRVNQLQVEQSLRNNYKFLQFPCCGDYLQPNMKPIEDKKTQARKKFFEEKEFKEQNKILHFDGVYDSAQLDQTSSRELVRLKSRMVRDLREEFFQENLELVADTQFFHNHLSRLANISTQNNQAISTFQKNAILSQRNNQKKNMPYELQISIGQLCLTKHQLQNPQQIKFQQLRPILKQFSDQSTYPILAQLQKQREYLMKVKEKLIQSDASNQEIGEVVKKLEMCSRMYKIQAEKLEGLMKEIIGKWKEIKQVRRQSGFESVPWRLNIKQYEIEKHKSFDIGLTGTEISPKPPGLAGQAQISRREKIREQMYMIKISINGYEVAKSQKIHLVWPSFRVPINSKFNVTVYSAPSSIQVEIIKVGLINRTIDTISLTLPGINSKTITASQRRFAGASFSSNGPKARKREEEPIAPAGLLIYRIQWKGQGSRMPPVSFKSQEEETAATEKTQEDNVDYLELYDIKDPRVHHKGKREEVEDEIIRAHGALLPFVDTQSMRHLLLKMKATQAQFQKLQIPLTQQQIRKRQDLIAVIQNQKLKTLDNAGTFNQQIYNPMQGIFKGQQKPILDQIKKILYQIQNLKINTLKGNSSARYKITQQIINEYVFEQMQSPIVVFFKNLFTQKRKLGPKITYYLQAKNVIDNMEVNLHMRSAKNIPIREDVLEKLRNLEQNQMEEVERKRAFQRMGAHTGNVDMYANYGMGFYQRPPNMNIQGQNFFVAGMINQNQNRKPFQTSYQLQKPQRSNSFLMLRFKKLLKRTECFQGPFPQWNQTIEFDYNLKQEQMTISKLYANNQKMMKLFLFDMVESSISTTAIANVNIKKTKFYLGRIDVPMSMMVAIPSLTGLFAVERPLVIFGYGIKKVTSYDNQPAEVDQSNKTEYPQIITLINLDLFSDPLIDNMVAYNEDRKFVTGARNESTMLLQRSSDWLSDLNTKMYIRLWINNVEGRSIFICRYLSDYIQPPPQLENSIQRCARFVSLIPRKYQCKLLENTEEFHLTCDQFLRVKMGEDHGILLCNFFNYIDKKAGRNSINSYLILGKAFPYGKSIFVLRRNSTTGDSQIWDPYSGHCYFYPAKEYDTFCCFFRYSKKKNIEHQKDFCNMIEIGSIVSATNVYVNAQDSLKPEDLDFNVMDEGLWKPFLTERMRNQYFQHSIIQTIQPPIDDNFYPRPRKMQPTIQKQLKQHIESNMRAQRLKHFNAYTFRINHNISDSIYHKLLLKCQTLKTDFRLTGLQSTFYTIQNKSKQYNDALSQIQQAKNKIKEAVDSDKILYGFTLNLPYTTKKDIWEKVQETETHLNQVESIQFVVAVRCFEVACQVYSVWVFVGSIYER